MNISVVLNYNEIPVEAYKMGTFNEFIDECYDGDYLLC